MNCCDFSVLGAVLAGGNTRGLSCGPRARYKGNPKEKQGAHSASHGSVDDDLNIFLPYHNA